MTAPAPHSMPAASVTLRPVVSGDTELLRAIYASTRADEMALVDWTDEQKGQFIQMQFHAQRTFYENQYPDAQFQIILVDEQPAGRLYVHRREKEIRVMDITLLPEFRGRGIGTALLQDVLAEARCSARPVTIHVESFNRAQRLYARLGFRQIASDGVYHLMEWKEHCAEANECGERKGA